MASSHKSLHPVAEGRTEHGRRLESAVVHTVLNWRSSSQMGFFFGFFFLSGFCSLVYQVVWLRVAMAGFGVTTPMISIVLSIFMAGLALGSWAGGRLVRFFEHRPARFFISVYGVSELVIGISGLAVAPLL